MLYIAPSKPRGREDREGASYRLERRQRSPPFAPRRPACVFYPVIRATVLLPLSWSLFSGFGLVSLTNSRKK
jgi:hypothetical protein